MRLYQLRRILRQYARYQEDTALTPQQKGALLRYAANEIEHELKTQYAEWLEWNPVRRDWRTFQFVPPEVWRKPIAVYPFNRDGVIAFEAPERVTATQRRFGFGNKYATLDILADCVDTKAGRRYLVIWDMSKDE